MSGTPPTLEFAHLAVARVWSSPEVARLVVEELEREGWAVERPAVPTTTAAGDVVVALVADPGTGEQVGVIAAAPPLP